MNATIAQFKNLAAFEKDRQLEIMLEARNLIKQDKFWEEFNSLNNPPEDKVEITRTDIENVCEEFDKVTKAEIYCKRFNIGKNKYFQ